MGSTPFVMNLMAASTPCSDIEQKIQREECVVLDGATEPLLWIVLAREQNGFLEIHHPLAFAPILTVVLLPTSASVIRQKLGSLK
jgi:hypothetical protein